MSHGKTPRKSEVARAKRPAKPGAIPSGSTRGGTKQEAVLALLIFVVFYKELAVPADPETGDAEPATRLFARATPVFAAEQVDNCALRLVRHEFRWDPTVMGNNYLKLTDETDPRFSTVNVPISAIAVSTGQNDSGVFELNFRDERYIAFEGAGAISNWRIELPKDFHEFDYNTITDVVMHLRYTALDGGDKLKGLAEASVKDYVKGAVDLSQDKGLFALFDLRHDFPNEWYKATNPADGATERVMDLGNVYERLPFFTKGTSPSLRLMHICLARRRSRTFCSTTPSHYLLIGRM
jgi:hypothetical protein